MSSKVPKRFRPSGKRPTNFSQVDKDVKFVCQLVKIIVGECRLVGSHANGIPFIDSDIDIGVEVNQLIHRDKINELSKLLGVKIDLTTQKGGFRIE